MRQLPFPAKSAVSDSVKVPPAPVPDAYTVAKSAVSDSVKVPPAPCSSGCIYCQHG